MVPKNLNKSSKASKANSSKEKNGGSVDNGDKTEEDKSVLRQPIDIGIRGVKDLMKALAGGTTEFQDLLLNECSVIYECKICYNLFRSLANFISHKRVYCVKSYCYFSENVNKVQSENQSQSLKQNDIVVIPDMPSQNEQNVNDAESWVTSDKTCNTESVTVDGLGTLTPRKKLDSLKTRRQDITEVIAGFNEKRESEVERTSEDVPDSVYYSDLARRMMQATPRPKTVVELESVNESCSSVFQTLKRPDYGYSVDSMKVQLIDLDRIVSKNQAILQENGKFVVTSQKMETEEEKHLEKHCCPFCDSSFLTQQTLSGHIQMYHRERVCYPCPLCKIFFASPTGVYRHLSKAHHRTEQQIRRLRPQVLSKARKRLLQSTSKDVCDIHDECKRSKREADEWMNNFEGALRCNGCGKLFNRRAVLNVHSMTCRKMAALLNASASQATSKAKSSSHTSKTTAKPALHGKSSKSMVPSQLPKSGILVRKDYGKTGNTQEKAHCSSLLTEVEKYSPRNEKYSELTGKVGSGQSCSKYSCSDKPSTSPDSSSVSCSSSSSSSSGSQKSSTSKKNSSDEAEPRKGKEKGAKKTSQSTSVKVHGISVKN